jgi:hypothetical protein
MAIRTTREVLDDHLALRKIGDLQTDLDRNYHPGIVCLTLTGIYRGHDGIRETASQLLESMRGGEYRYRCVQTAEAFGYLVWDGESDRATITDGTDSYVIRDGLIVAQTIHYRVDPKP